MKNKKRNTVGILKKLLALCLMLSVLSVGGAGTAAAVERADADTDAEEIFYFPMWQGTAHLRRPDSEHDLFDVGLLKELVVGGEPVADGSFDASTFAGTTRIEIAPAVFTVPGNNTVTVRFENAECVLIQADNEFPYGDIDADGRITSKDARRALRLSARLDPDPGDGTGARADTNFDGRVNSADARYILRTAAKLEPGILVTYLYPELAELFFDADFLIPAQAVASADRYEDVDLDAFSALVQRLSSVDAETFSALLDLMRQNPVFSQALIEIAEVDCIPIPHDQIYYILFDESRTASLRQAALIYCDAQGTEYAQAFETLATDEQIGHTALRIFYGRDPAGAAALAGRIIDAYHGDFTKPLQGALLVKLHALSESSDADERQSYVDFCDKLIYGDRPVGKTERKLLFGYLLEFDCWESLNYLVNNSDFPYRSLLAEEHYHTISGVLTGEPDPEKLSVVFRALLGDPDIGFIDLLTDHLEANAGFYAEHPALSDEANEALSLMLRERQTIAGQS